MSPKPYYTDDYVTLYHGDAREVLGELEAPAEQAAVVTDPPYSSGGNHESGKKSGSVARMKGHAEIHADALTTRGYTLLIRDVLRKTEWANELAIFTDWRMYPTLVDTIEYAGACVRAMIVWAKAGGGLGHPYVSQHELVAYARRSTAAIQDRSRVQPTCNVIHHPRTRNEWHPTEKPVEVMRRIIGGTAASLIVDPFAGSGTTLLAARDLGRRSIGIEYDEAHLLTIVDRLAQQPMEAPQPPLPITTAPEAATDE